MAKLEFIFYGVACFVPLEGRKGYRVLLPNGLAGGPHMTPHEAAIWVRPLGSKVDTNWPADHTDRTDFYFWQNTDLKISGLKDAGVTPEFAGYLTNLKKCDVNFEISKNPNAVLDLEVTQGKLSVHEMAPDKMRVVKWTVERDPNATVILTAGRFWMELPTHTTQVFFANAARVHPHIYASPHFPLFLELTDHKTARLKFVRPGPPQHGKTWLDHPTIAYPATRTPDIMCSPAVLAAPSGL